MIAYLLLRLRQDEPQRPVAAALCRAGRQCLFIRKPIAALDKPPDVNPSSPKPKCNPAQLELAYA
jgi:putative transposase